MTDFWNDPKTLRAMRNLCPDGKRITGVTFSTPGRPPVTLTVETRKKINQRLKTLKEEP